MSPVFWNWQDHTPKPQKKSTFWDVFLEGMEKTACDQSPLKKTSEVPSLWCLKKDLPSISQTSSRGPSVGKVPTAPNLRFGLQFLRSSQCGKSAIPIAARLVENYRSIWVLAKHWECQWIMKFSQGPLLTYWWYVMIHDRFQIVN